MKIELTPVSKGSHVDIFADVAIEGGDKSEYALVANAITFSPRRLYASDTQQTTLLSLPVKEARQFARRVLALTRQDGDVEGELEVENRELKAEIDKLKGLAGELSLRSGKSGEGSKDEPR